MKIIYSHLKKLIPALPSDPKKVGNDLTMIGHFMDGFDHDQDNSIISLEIRQNRGDALSYYGLAKELATLYRIPLRNPKISLPSTPKLPDLPIKIKSLNDVKRVMAVRISDVKVKESPSWLKDFLNKHEINSINNIVDLTNYIMLYYGIPCHAFDVTATGSQLIWENNNQYQNFTTIDGTVLKLEKDMLLVSNPNQPLSLSFVGGQNSGIKPSTTETIIEMAVYNRSRVRQDSRQLKTITEASIRLDKELDTDSIPQSFNHLISLVLDLAQGHISSHIFDKYIQKPEPITISFNLEKPSVYAGIPIPNDFAQKTLHLLGCQLRQVASNQYQVIPPTDRKDLQIEEDLIEEVIRFWGYHKIPLNQPISDKPLPDITPPILYLIDSIKNILFNLGYDEIRSWPLIKPSSLITKFIPKNARPIYTENNINSDYPVLRPSLTSSLIGQKDFYDRFKLPLQQFFEIGKTYYQIGDKYIEKYSLAIFNQSTAKLQEDVKNIFTTINISSPKFNQHIDDSNNLYLEIDLEQVSKIVDVDLLKSKRLFLNHDYSSSTSYELTKQIITLDANVNLDNFQDPKTLLNQYRHRIDPAFLWQIDIIDIYQNPNQNIFRYTFRVSYYNTDDKTAKSIHLKAFDLS